MKSRSQIHPCVLLLLPVVYSEAAQPTACRLWSPLCRSWRPVTASSPLWRQTPTGWSTVTERGGDRRQNRGERSPRPRCLSPSVLLHLWVWTQVSQGSTAADALSSRRAWQPSCFCSLSIYWSSNHMTSAYSSTQNDKTRTKNGHRGVIADDNLGNIPTKYWPPRTLLTSCENVTCMLVMTSNRRRKITQSSWCHL